MTEENGAVDGDHYDVVVIGGGPAGSAAAVFTGRYGLDTLVLDRGRSSLQRVAHLENYLGFPAGIDIETFYELLHAQVERAGCTVRDDSAESVELTADGFRTETADTRSFESDYVVAASKYDHEYLRGIDDEALFTAEQYQGDTYTTIDTTVVDRGRTPVSGLYLAGRLAQDRAQVQLHTGHGVEVAHSLITDRRRERGFPKELATAYCDWAVVEGGYGGDNWETELRDRFDDTLPDEPSLSEERIARLREKWVSERLDWQLTPEERDRRRTEGQRALAQQLDDEVLLESVDDELIRDYAADFDASEVSE
ncbi:MAG: FAD-dependent oxidoreductase [Haloarcula sp.]